MKEDKYDVFIAYTEADRDMALWFRRQLEDCNEFRVYFDQHSNKPGEVAEGLRIIDNCHVVLAIWSPEALKSDWVNYESTYAFAQNKIIPIAVSNINNGDIPDPIRTVQYVKFSFDDSQTVCGNEVSPDNKGSWSRVLNKIKILSGRKVVPIDKDSKSVQCKVLLLDDQPKLAIEIFSTLLQKIGAARYGRRSRLSDEAVSLGSSGDCENHFIFGLGSDEVANITVTANGVHDQANIVKSIQDPDFLGLFDVIIVDMMWNAASDLFKEDIFKSYKSTNPTFEVDEVGIDEAGMLLCKMIADVLEVTSNVPIVISTHQTIDSEFVAKALEYRAHSLIGKSHEIALCNILLTVLKRKQRDLIRSARAKLIDS